MIRYRKVPSGLLAVPMTTRVGWASETILATRALSLSMRNGRFTAGTSAGFPSMKPSMLSFEAGMTCCMDRRSTESTVVTGAPVTTVDSVLRLSMQQVIPASNESMLGFIDGKPALVPAVNLPFRIDKDSALVARIVSEAHPTRVVIGTAKSPLGTLRYLIIPVRVAGDPNTGLYVAAYDLDAELGQVADSFQTYI